MSTSVSRSSVASSISQRTSASPDALRHVLQSGAERLAILGGEAAERVRHDLLHDRAEQAVQLPAGRRQTYAIAPAVARSVGGGHELLLLERVDEACHAGTVAARGAGEGGLRAVAALPERGQDRVLLGREVLTFLLEHPQDVGSKRVVCLVQPEHDAGLAAVGRFGHNCCCDNSAPLLAGTQPAA